MDRVQEEMAKITGAAIYINECCSLVMEVYGVDAVQLLDANVKFYFANILQTYQIVAPQELQDAMYFFICFVEKCTQHKNVIMNIELCDQFHEIALWAKDEDIEVKQNAVYGIGVMAKFTSQDAFKSLVPKAESAIKHLMSNKDQDEDYQVVVDNSLIALGFLAVYQTQSAD